MVVVLPTPPFWLHIEMTRAWPWLLIGRGSGRYGHRPAGRAEHDLGLDVGLDLDLDRLDLDLLDLDRPGRGPPR